MDIFDPAQPTSSFDPATLPPHVADAVRAIALLHAEHTRKASFADKLADYCTDFVGTPSFLIGLGSTIFFWIVGNAATTMLGGSALDPPPFEWLDLALTTAGILIAVLILASQKRADRLAHLREQMNLESTLLTEQKARKIIELVEELRKDSPNIADRSDREAQEMAMKTDPHQILSAVEKTARSPGEQN
jgi:uncharacterized membrane protein